jgi:hypothetical protein
MSRKTIYRDPKITVVEGVDHMLGKFYQIYDRDMEQETSEGEGIVLDWNGQFGYETNLTGIPNKPDVTDLINEYLMDNINNRVADIYINEMINLN